MKKVEKEQRADSEQNEKKTIDRIERVQMQETNPEMSKTELRNLNPAYCTLVCTEMIRAGLI